jgi:uncharacterized protein (DUF111 family)
VRRKLKILGGRITSAKPEFEDCARLARENHIPLHKVYSAAQAAEPE